MAEPGRIRIGTSGWHYVHWKGPFYPENLPAEGFLEFFSRRFKTVEINNSFYKLPEASALRSWRETAPPGFIFAAKGSRYITHMKKLKDPEPALTTFVERMAVLGDKLGPVIFQLPPRWSFNPARLRHFLGVLPPGHRYALELREPSWINPEALEALAAHNVAFCIYELAGYLSPKEVTADFVYIRLHGPGAAYQGSYDTRTLAGWAGAISSWAVQGKDVYCYFDNDEAGYAARNALELQEMLLQG